ncbi:MAG: HD-GYP domain-containing protein [Gammaproteobacteria bacterium]
MQSKPDNSPTGMQDLAHQYLCTVDEALHFVATDPAYNRMLGYGPGELDGVAVDTVVAPEDWLRVREHIQRRFSGEESISRYIFRARRKDGSEFYVSNIATVVTQDGRRVSVSVFEDLSERIQEEYDKRTQEQHCEEVMQEALQAMAMMSSMRDPYTGRHEGRVGDLAMAIGLDLGLDQRQCEGLRACGTVHDIGKISVPAEILAKPSQLSAPEFEIVRGHASLGYEILRNLQLPEAVAITAHQHHERLDGSGYPLGIKGEEIILESRIMTVADIVEAMASHRPYRPALGIEAALTEIKVRAGTQLDARVVETCIHLFTKKNYVFPAD